MSFTICKAKIYEFKNEKGRRIPDYIIKNNYDGRFLEWIDINPTGIKEVDQDINSDGSVIVHKRSHAEAIIEKLED
ncbi:MAG: hypothetical protein HY587_02895 [Candidatus Omnitrophica bacterium]|nr:hypothetical protein [Candidatus Omnitrophota bacterium]